MTTRTYSSVVDHTSDAGFRAWGSELASNLQAAGLVQTADTGQINWTTVTRPGTNTEAGYEVYKLNDSLFATAPIYLRLGYGTSTLAANPRIQIIAGTGTNGAGTITGTVSSTGTVATTSIASTVTSYISYICVKEGFFGLLWKNNGAGSPAGTGLGFGAISRTCDTTGAYTSTGFQLLTIGTAGTRVNEQCVRTATTAATYTASTALAIVPGSVTSSAIGADLQVYLHWMHTPGVSPSINTCTLVNAEITATNTFSVTLFGSTAHTYLSIGTQGGLGDATGLSTFGVGFIWE